MNANGLTSVMASNFLKLMITISIISIIVIVIN